MREATWGQVEGRAMSGEKDMGVDWGTEGGENLEFQHMPAMPHQRWSMEQGYQAIIIKC